MKYVTGIPALNMKNELNTFGDWHRGTIDWLNLKEVESSESVLGDWGIESGLNPVTNQPIKKANHIRAILDILEGRVDTPIEWLYQFKHDFISTDEYDELIVEKASLLKESSNWEKIDLLMKSTFPLLWREKVYGFELYKRERTSRGYGCRPKRDI